MTDDERIAEIRARVAQRDRRQWPDQTQAQKDQRWLLDRLEDVIWERNYFRSDAREFARELTAIEKASRGEKSS